MNTMAEALSKANIKANDFEDRKIDEKSIKLDMEIEFLEKWCKLLQRNASEKEKHNFVINHGFVSVKQFSLYMACMDDVHNLKEKLEDIRNDISNYEIARREKEIAKKMSMAEQIKDELYYRFVLRTLGQQDITPYGENILKRKMHYKKAE
ncbi:MAG: hypothetical protein K0R54_749 [Clostridiaceae bacterium]|jgi:hypothetical protein|nr:hypothetical protein [Clostridiaceae bacterium]